MAVSSIIEMLSNPDIYKELLLSATFIDENCSRLVNTLTLFETTKYPMAVKVFNVITDLQIYLTHCSISDTYGEKTDDLSLCTS